MRWGTITEARHLLALAAAHVAVLLSATVAGAFVFGAVEPILQTYLINSLAAQTLRPFAIVVVLLVAMNIAYQALMYVSSVQSQEVKRVITARLIQDTFSRFYSMPFLEYISHDDGYYIARIFDEPSQLANELVDTVVTFTRRTITFAGAGVVALWLSWKVALVVTAVVPLLLRLSRRYGARLTDLSKTLSEREADIKATLGRAVASFTNVYVFGLIAVVAERMATSVQQYLSLLTGRATHAARFQAFSSISFAYAELIVSLGAGLQVVRGQLSVGGLFGFMSAYFRAVSAANALLSQVPDIAKLAARFTRLREFGGQRDTAVNPSRSAVIALMNIEAGYGATSVLSRFSLRLPRGRRILITGPNGTGKSTLMYVLTGLLPVRRGVANVPAIDSVSASLLPCCFIPGTVSDNLAVDRLPDESRLRCMHLANQLGVGHMMDQDPASLSMGEQRKVQLLMALTKEADYYLLDEPLAHVDADSKATLMQCILARTHEKGLMVIMHGDDQFGCLFDETYDIRTLSGSSGADQRVLCQ